MLMYYSPVPHCRCARFSEVSVSCPPVGQNHWYSGLGAVQTDSSCACLAGEAVSPSSQSTTARLCMSFRRGSPVSPSSQRTTLGQSSSSAAVALWLFSILSSRGARPLGFSQAQQPSEARGALLQASHTSVLRVWHGWSVQCIALLHVKFVEFS
jgi:hypothetical protein